MMKKMMTMLVAASMIGVSCNSDNPTSDPPVEATADVTYGYQVSADALTMMNVELLYTDADKQEVKEALTSTTKWEKKLTKVALPFQPKLQVVYTIKPGFVPEKATYVNELSYSVGYMTTDGRGNTDASNLNSSILKDKVLAYLDLFVKINHIYTLNITE